MFLQVENVEQVDFLNTWLGGPKTKKQKLPLIFPISALTAKEQINVWNMSQESMSLESP